MVILTNCTFDGHVYNTKRYMEELLAIKPDLVVCAACIAKHEPRPTLPFARKANDAVK
jgi:arginine/lysine/ornithine decarboxylase